MTVFPYKIIVLLLALAPFLGACGIEVGNPSEPVPVPTKAEADKDTLLQLAGTQIDEGISAVLESFEGSLSASLRLKRGGQGRTGKCLETTTGIRLTYTDDFEDKSLRGPDSRRLAIQEKASHTLQADLQSSTGLTCQGASSKFQFDWANQGLITVVARSEREREREVRLQNNPNRVLRSRQLTSRVEKTVSIQKIREEANVYTLQKRLSFSAEADFLQNQPSGSTKLSLQSSTPEGSSLVIEEQMDREGQRRSLTLVSGSLITKRADDLKIKLFYENLQFSAAASCYPTSGSIQGSVYSGGISEAASSQFQVLFTEDGPILRYEDGSEVELILEACQLNPY
jgi:hypothetical protein